MFNKIFERISSAAISAVKKEEPVYRFGGGWQTMGAQVRPKDIRTPAQIDATIDALMERIPAIKKFKEQIKQMKPIDRALISDTLELANRQEMLMTSVDMVQHKAADGKSIIQVLLPKFIKASKENPEALRFTQEVINNTDTHTSKYLLANLAGFNPEGILNRKRIISRIAHYEASMSSFEPEKFNSYITKRTQELEENPNTFIDALAHFEADCKNIKNYYDYRAYIKERTNELKTSPIIKNDYTTETILDTPQAGKYLNMSIPFIHPIAESTINGAYLGTFEKQKRFVRTIEELLSTDATPDKLSALSNYNLIMNRLSQDNELNAYTINSFVETKTPLIQLKTNIAQLPAAFHRAKAMGERFNPLEYVMTNVNFAKAQPKFEIKSAAQISLAE